MGNRRQRQLVFELLGAQPVHGSLANPGGRFKTENGQAPGGRSGLKTVLVYGIVPHCSPDTKVSGYYLSPLRGSGS